MARFVFLVLGHQNGRHHIDTTRGGEGGRTAEDQKLVQGPSLPPTYLLCRKMLPLGSTEEEKVKVETKKNLSATSEIKGPFFVKMI
jgi:hypothetical protein